MVFLDFVDDNLATEENTLIFVIIICEGDSGTTARDTTRLLEMNKTPTFSGMLDSIDCMHCKWKNYPVEWHGQFKGNNKDIIIILEALAEQET